MQKPHLAIAPGKSIKKSIFITIMRFLDIVGYAFVFAFLLMLIVPVHSNSYIIENNQHQKIMFEGMIHISPPQYYHGIGKEITEKMPANSTIYIEGIRPDNDDPEHEVNPTTANNRTPDINDIYSNFAKKSGLILQDYNIVLQPTIKKNPHIKDVDVTEKEIAHTINTQTNKMNKQQSTIFNISNKPYVIRAILRLSLHKSALFNRYDYTNNNDPIIGQRNTRIIHDMQKHHTAFNVIIYGNEHWKNLFYQLKQQDPTWHIIYQGTHTGF